MTYNEDGYVGEKASIYKIIAAVQNGFELDLSDMVGLPVTVMIQKYKKGSGKNTGKEDNKLTAVLPMKAKNIATAGSLINKPLFFDLGEPDLAVWNKLYRADCSSLLKVPTLFPTWLRLRGLLKSLSGPY